MSLLELTDIHFAYPNGHSALHGVSFALQEGEKVGLVGANSAGKSTLLLHCNGCLFPQQGEVVLAGESVKGTTLATVRKITGTVFQDTEDQLFMPTISDDIAFAPRNLGLSEDEVHKRVQQALEAVGATYLSERTPLQLSGGEKRLAAIATALSLEPRLLLLDEPSANLDPKARRRLINLLQKLPHTMLIASHDLDMIYDICPRTLVLANGTVQADAKTVDLFSDASSLDAWGLELPLRFQND